MARRFRLLADRAEVLYEANAGKRAEHVMAMDLAPLDTLLLAGADDTDRICAHAVALLRERYVSDPWGDPDPEDEIEQDELARELAILDGLSVLDSDRLLGIRFALPDHRRAVTTDHPVWAHAVEHKPRRVEQRIADLDALADWLPVEDEMVWRPDDDDLLSDEDEAGLRRFRDDLLRGMLTGEVALGD